MTYFESDDALVSVLVEYLVDEELLGRQRVVEELEVGVGGGGGRGLQRGRAQQRGRPRPRRQRAARRQRRARCPHAHRTAHRLTHHTISAARLSLLVITRRAHTHQPLRVCFVYFGFAFTKVL